MLKIFLITISLACLLFGSATLSYAGPDCEAACQNVKNSGRVSPKTMSCQQLCRNIELNIVETAAHLCKRSISKVSDYDLCTELVLDLLLK